MAQPSPASPRSRSPTSPTETTPLVGTIHEPGIAAPTTPSSTLPIHAQPTSRAWSDIVRGHVSAWKVLYLNCLFTFLVDFPVFMGEASRLRMLELGLCREHYALVNPGLIGRDGSVAEHLCKVREVQSALARMRGFLSLLDYLPGLTLAIPYGIIADMRGRKLVLAMSLLGLTLRDTSLWNILFFYQTFPIRAVYSAPALLVLGGGSTVLTATALAVLAAATPEEKRTQSFLYQSVTILVSELLAPLIGSLLLDKIGPYATFITTIPLICLGFIPLAMFPSEKRTEGSMSGASLSDSHSAADEADDTIDYKGFKYRLWRRFRRLATMVRHDLAPILFQRPLLLGVASLAIQKLARPMLELLLQYMSVRFGWSLSKSAFLISIQAAAQIILFLFAVPQVYGWFLRRQNDVAMANLSLARLCVMFLILGSLFMAIAPIAPIFILAVIFYTCGTGYSQAMRSFLTSLIHKDHTTLLYTTMALFESLASLTASPLLGLAFSAGINMGGLAVALPFFMAAGLYAVAAAGIWLIRLERRNLTL